MIPESPKSNGMASVPQQIDLTVLGVTLGHALRLLHETPTYTTASSCCVRNECLCDRVSDKESSFRLPQSCPVILVHVAKIRFSRLSRLFTETQRKLPTLTQFNICSTDVLMSSNRDPVGKGSQRLTSPTDEILGLCVICRGSFS